MNKKNTLLPLLLVTLFLNGCLGDSDNSNSSYSSNNQESGQNSNTNNSTPQALYSKIIKKTGQTKSYNGNGEEVTDGSLKDDGAYQKGATIQYQRDDSQNIVKDLATNLLWEDSEHVESSELSYKNADNYCSNLSLGESINWRVPSIKELMSLVDYSKRAPSLDTTFINAAYGLDNVGYWSSNVRGFGWQMWVNFFSGKIHWFETSPNIHYIRCVNNSSSQWAEANFSRSTTTVTDNNSMLEWQDNTTAAKLKWEDAINYCENLTLNGKSDWRLPNINELFSITEHSKGSPTINSIFKNTTEGFYWSSTSYSGDSSYAWVVSFEYGSNTYYSKQKSYSVRCVRAGR